MRIAFLWFFDKAPLVYPNWRDGLRAAIEIIGKDHEVDWIIGKKYPEDKYDAIIFWDDSNSEFFNKIDDYHCKKALCLTTDPHNFDNLRKLDAVYCESQPVYEAVRAFGIHAIRAFGTDTEFYAPIQVTKDIEYFYPATFSPWKRQSTLAHLGDKLYCVGTIQPDGQDEYDSVINAGAMVEEGYFPPEYIRSLYERSKHVIIPAIHGSERTVLESMSMGIIPLVIPTNVRAFSYLNELKESGLKPRPFVIKNYSAQKYANDIMKGIE